MQPPDSTQEVLRKVTRESPAPSETESYTSTSDLGYHDPLVSPEKPRGRKKKKKVVQASDQTVQPPQSRYELRSSTTGRSQSVQAEQEWSDTSRGGSNRSRNLIGGFRTRSTSRNWETDSQHDEESGRDDPEGSREQSRVTGKQRAQSEPPVDPDITVIGPPRPVADEDGRIISSLRMGRFP